MRLLLTGALGTRAGRETIRAASAVRKESFSSALAAGFLAFCVSANPAAAQPRQPATVAVLPVSDFTSDVQFADGLTDEIAFALTKVPGLAVVGRSSVFINRKGDQVLLPQTQFQLDTYRSGTKAGHLTIHVELLKAGETRVLWTKDYDQTRDNLIDVEEDIGLGVASAVGHPLRLARGEHLLKSRPKDMDAYEQFLRAKSVARGRGAQALADASNMLETILARDPDFEPAAAMISYEYALTPLFAPALRSGKPEEERQLTGRLIPRAEAFAERAVALDPKDATAWVGLGYVRLVQRKMVAAEDAFKQALQLDPNQADGLHGYSQFLAAMGKIKESLAMRDHLQAIEPFIVNYTADTAEIYWLTGATDKAIEMLQPFRPGRTMELALIESAAGRYHDAASALREMPPSNWPDGLLEKAAKLLDAAPAQAPPSAASRPLPPQAGAENPSNSLPGLGSLSFVFLHVGAPERVLEYYEDEVKGGYFQPISATWFWHPSYAVVRRTDRFKRLVRDLGMVDYWRARGWPQWCHPAGANDFACE